MNKEQMKKLFEDYFIPFCVEYIKGAKKRDDKMMKLLKKKLIKD